MGAVLVAAQLRSLHVRVSDGHNLDVIFFDAHRAAAVPCIRIEGVALACDV